MIWRLKIPKLNDPNYIVKSFEASETWGTIYYLGMLLSILLNVILLFVICIPRS